MAHPTNSSGRRTMLLAAGTLLAAGMPAFAQTPPTPAPAPPPSTSSAAPESGAGQDYASERATAVALFKNHEFLKALPLFEELYSKNQNDIPVLEGLTAGLLARSSTVTDQEAATKDRLRAKQMIERARSLGDQSQYSESMSGLLKNIDEKSTLSFSEKADANAAMKAGEAAFAKNDFDEAIKNYKRAIELEPSNYWAVLFVGDSYFASKRFPDAAEWYTKAQELDPNQETAFRYHADMLVKQGDFAGARVLNLDAIVASPYDAKTWRALVEWAKVAHVTLERVHIETGASTQPGGDGKISVNIDPNQPSDLMQVWMIYSGARIRWQKEEFAKNFPNEKQYRHTLAEEVDALSTAAVLAEGSHSSAIAKDPNVQLLLKLYHAKMLEPYVLLNGADQGIAQDYAGYRAQNRAKLVEYLGEFVAPKPAGAQSTPAAN